MIEFCTKKRMAAVIAILISVTLVVLMVENNISHDAHTEAFLHEGGNLSNLCSGNAVAKNHEDCHECSVQEKIDLVQCKHTGYVLKASCNVNNTLHVVNLSCPRNVYIEERNFWIFELCAGSVGLLSYAVVYWRQRRLEKLLIEKVNRQIASGS
ncbi:hypothetical protein HELRODRAFT_181010 [Helobdella robusta]|uniref:Jumping translocation breakpoint protein n=1 Tax=Helobdella robusta TaxID=6412 RepID=T1FGI7_HELRO|nr:hypothetical protein HELRODRAFT_181010 [Helobdella robusta]ESN93466.1 hypothetical protein HELRODRAFT_181010 [Helobdella robusta]